MIASKMIIETPCDNVAWYIYRANCVTLGKRPKKNKVFDKAWCLAQLHAQHSTLEQVHLYLYDPACRGDVTSHIVRHTKGHPRPVVESWRPDWTGQPRPPYDAPRQFLAYLTPYALIEMMRQRLCVLAATPTRQWAESVKVACQQHGDVFIQTLGEYVMPDCEYRGGVCHQDARRTCGRCPHYSSAAAC